MSITRIVFCHMHRSVVTFAGRGQRFVYRSDAPVCSMQPGRRRF